MKNLLKLVRDNNLDVKFEYVESMNQIKVTVHQGKTMICMMLDSFDISRGYTPRELEEVIINYICSNLRIER